MNWFKTIIIALIALPIPAAYAVPTDPLIEGAKLCTRHLPHYEREYAIPTHLLSAIASTESGRYHEGLGMKLPWPWAINANGKGYFFETKEDAIAAVQKLRRHGVQSIDVGCMQVNLYQHPEAFSSLSDAFEPQKNIAYAASFLHDLYTEGGTWKKAAANYHSRTPSLGKEYVSLVYDSWYTIIDKLRAARLNVPDSAVAAMNDLKRPSKLASHSDPHVIRVASANTGAAFEHPHMHSIRVSTESTESQNGVTIIRGDSSPVIAYTEPHPVSQPAIAHADVALTAQAAPVSEAKTEIKTADSTPLQTSLSTPVQTLAADPATGHATDAVALSELSPSAGHRSLDATPVQKTGPSFIFND